MPPYVYLAVYYTQTPILGTTYLVNYCMISKCVQQKTDLPKIVKN